MITKAIYPGTFDPITNGHLDLLNRAAKIFDYIVLGIAASPNKRPLFDLNERIFLAKKVTSHLPNVKIAGFSGLVVYFARQQKASTLIRGVRSMNDIGHEIQLAKINRYLMPKIETIFMISNEAWTYTSSTIVKEIASQGGDITYFLPSSIAQEVQTRLTLDNRDQKLPY